MAKGQISDIKVAITSLLMGTENHLEIEFLS